MSNGARHCERRGSVVSVARLARCAWLALRVAMAFVATASVGAIGSVVHAKAPIPDVLDADDPTITDDLPKANIDLAGTEDSDEDIVIAAQKVRTTIQEAPGIITVITNAQIKSRGFRTINEAVSTVPGFEGDRWEANGWHKEAFARGLPRTVLVLINGVNVTEPLRNFINLDRKFPMETIERIEVTSGPGGVLWGANALLGIINIVTKGPDDKGFHAVAGFGDGPADRLQFKVGMGYSGWFDDEQEFGLFTHVSLYSTMGPDLVVDQQKIIGSLPLPAPDSPTLYLPTPIEVNSGNRSYYFNFTGRLKLGPVSIDWIIPFEEDYRVVQYGSAAPRIDYLDASRQAPASVGSDSVRMVSLTYADRFLSNDLGLKLKLYVVQHHISEKPFRLYSPSPITLALFNHTEHTSLEFRSDFQGRAGMSLDVDYKILDNLQLITGGEFYADINHNTWQRSFAADVLGRCPQDYTYNPDDPYLPCYVDDLQVANAFRFIGGAFAVLDWKPVDSLALTAGARAQLSSSYDPAFQFQGGFVWNIVDDLHWKGFVSTGFRPPNFTSTGVLPTHSGVSLQANPDLRVEKSLSYETEFNLVTLQDVGPIRDLYIRINGAYTEMSDVITSPAGVWQNSGERQIASAEAALRLRFDGGHEIWGNYSFTRVFDQEAPNGEYLQNMAQHMGTVGAKVQFLNEQIELNVWANFKSEMWDQNRPAVLSADRPDYSVSCAQLSKSVYPDEFGLSQLQKYCQAPGLEDAIWVLPGHSVAEKLRPTVLLNAGLRFKNLWKDLTAAIYVHNILDMRYYEPDFFNDPRVISRPQPKPGLSVFAQLSIGL